MTWNMSNLNEPSHYAPERKLALSSLIRRTMVTVAEREEQRSKLISVLILAQFLLTAITTAGYMGSPMMVASLLLGVFALAIYVSAYVTNRLFRRTGAAAYILIVGGGLAISAQTLALALEGQPLQASQAALLFIAIILESGLLFSPEITLLTAFSTTVFAAFSILLGLSNNHTVARAEAYFSVAFTLGILALTALISWLLSQYIFETALESQRGQELQFAQARLEALLSQNDEHQRLLGDSVTDLLQAISRVMVGDYLVRIGIPESELTPLAESLNLLFQTYETASKAEQDRSRMNAAAVPMITQLGSMSNTGPLTPNSLHILTNTPLDSVSMALGQMQAALNQRHARVQRLAGELVSTLSHSQEPLSDTVNTVNESQRLAGALIADTETLLKMTRWQRERVLAARRRLSTLLPEEITRTESNTPRSDTGELTGLATDLGIGPSGYTGQFGVIIPEGTALSSKESGIARMTQPLQSVSPSAATGRSRFGSHEPGNGGGEGSDSSSLRAEFASGTPSDSAGELLAELVETWNLTSQLDERLRQSEQLLSNVESQLGTQSRQLRTVDSSIAWFRSALQAVISNAEQLQQIAQLPIQSGADSSVPPASPSRPLTPPPGLPESRTPFPGSGGAGPREMNPESVGQGATAGGADDSVHAPGSLRASDLLAFDDINFASLEDPTRGDKERPNED